MKSSTTQVHQTRRLAIFSFLILSVLLTAGQISGFGQSNARLAPSKDRLIKVEGPGTSNLSAAETAAYIETARIPIKGDKGQLAASRGEVAYLISSVEKLNVSNPRSSERKVVSVINYKTASANKSAFYVIEAAVKGDSVVFELKRDSRVLQSFAAKVIRANLAKGPGVDPCIQMNKERDDTIKSAQLAANQSCQTKGACVGYCSNNGASIRWEIIRVEPTNPRCVRNYSEYTSNFDFGLLVAVDETPHGPLLESTLWTAVRNVSALFY